MRQRLRQVAMLLLGAMLLGTIGLSAGSWYGGRGTVPLSFARTREVAAEMLPEAEPAGGVSVRGYRYGVFLAADDFGSAYAEYHYGYRPDCTLSEQLRRNAVSRGWQDVRRVPGEACDGWRAEADGLLVTLTHPATGSVLRVAPAAPDRFLAVTLVGALLGAAAGVALFWLVARRRPPVRRLVRTLVVVALLPGAVLTWSGLLTDGLTEPVWPIWRSLAPLGVPLSLALLLAAWIVLTRRQKRAGSATAGAAGVRGQPG